MLDEVSQVHLPMQEDAFNNLVDTLSKKLYSTAVFCQTTSPETHPTPTLTSQNRELNDLYSEANTVYDDYLTNCRDVGDWSVSRERANKFTMDMYTQKEINSWKTVISSSDSCDLWRKINWSGEVNSFRTVEDLPPLRSLADQFMSKSSLPDDGENLDFFNVPGNVYVHELDKPIEQYEISEGIKLLKSSSLHLMVGFQE